MQMVTHTLFENFQNQIILYLLRSLHFGMTLIIGSIFFMFILDVPPIESHTTIRFDLCHGVNYINALNLKTCSLAH